MAADTNFLIIFVVGPHRLLPLKQYVFSNRNNDRINDFRIRYIQLFFLEEATPLVFCLDSLG
jgi:hypothetical protein